MWLSLLARTHRLYVCIEPSASLANRTCIFAVKSNTLDLPQDKSGGALKRKRGSAELLASGQDWLVTQSKRDQKTRLSDICSLAPVGRAERSKRPYDRTATDLSHPSAPLSRRVPQERGRSPVQHRGRASTALLTCHCRTCEGDNCGAI